MSAYETVDYVKLWWKYGNDEVVEEKKIKKEIKEEPEDDYDYNAGSVNVKLVETEDGTTKIESGYKAVKSEIGEEKKVPTMTINVAPEDLAPEPAKNSKKKGSKKAKKAASKKNEEPPRGSLIGDAEAERLINGQVTIAELIAEAELKAATKAAEKAALKEAKKAAKPAVVAVIEPRKPRERKPTKRMLDFMETETVKKSRRS